MRLAAHGIRIELPRGWSGRVFSRQDSVATLHVANYTVALPDGEFGDRSTASMPSGACFVAMTEYRPGAGLEPGHGLFSARRLAVPLDPASFSARALAHPRPGQVGMQQFLTLAGRPFCLYVVIAGGSASRRRQLLTVDHVLRSLEVGRRWTPAQGWISWP